MDGKFELDAVGIFSTRVTKRFLRRPQSHAEIRLLINCDEPALSQHEDRLRRHSCGDSETETGGRAAFLVYGHGFFRNTLLRCQLLDVLILAVNPVFLGSGTQIFRDDQRARIHLIAGKSYSKGVVKLSFEPSY
jgi:dihydrofolate reductase